MTKYEELEKLQKLKESGAITQAEFEVEKQKIFNNSKVNPEKKKVKMSRIFFILTAVFVIITIVAYKYENNCYEKEMDYVDNEYKEAGSLRYCNAITEEEYKEICNQSAELGETHSKSQKMLHISEGITVVMLAAGIVFKIIEKKEEK